MIGNDIIDLQLSRIESNWKRRGFFEKLFTENERKMISSASNQEVMVWSLWSRKEAAYKIYYRETKKRMFNPKGIECSAIDFVKGQAFGTAIIEGSTYYTRTEVTDEYIYTEAVSNRKYFREIIAVDVISISKDKYGLPNSIYSNNPVSITHHGLFLRRIELDINSQSRLKL